MWMGWGVKMASLSGLGKGLAVAGLVLTLTGPGPGPGVAAASPAVTVLEDRADGIVFTVTTPAFSLDTLAVDGRPYGVVRAPGLRPFAREGEPNLPVLPVLVALPPGSEARIVSVERLGETMVAALRPVPVERMVASEEDGRRYADLVYAEKDSVYQADLIFPTSSAWLADRGRIRSQEVVRVLVAPFRYEPGTGKLTVAGQVRVRLDYEGGASLRQVVGPADAWEGVYREVILNYEQGRRWRAPRPAALQAPPESNQRIKLAVSKTGIYRVSFDSLASAGLPAGLALGQLMVWQDVFKAGFPDTIQARECALETIDADADGIFSPGDAVKFYARDFYDQYGRRGNEDFFADRNVYWLSWGPGDHARITSRPGWRDAASPVRPAAFPDFIHVEQDSYFVNFPPQTAGDLAIDPYVWTKQRRITPFDLPGIDTSYTTRLVANFVSYYNVDGDYRSQPRTSTISLYMTGPLGVQTGVGTVTASLPGVKLASVDVPPGLLGEAANRFRFESSLLSTSALPGNVLDWFEVEYQRRYLARGDALVFTSAGATGEVEYEVGGFTSGSIEILDVTDPDRPERIEVEAGRIVEDGGAYKVTFQDSVASTRTYVALAPQGVLGLGPERLALKPAPLAREASADYIVVSHPGFAAGLEGLLARKRDQGHTVYVATTDQVYDDFGNGLKSDAAIKRFIGHAYANGGAEFVLLVGDANIDHRGVLLGLPYPGPQIPSDVDYVPTHGFVRSDGLQYNKETRPSDNWFVTLDGDGDPYPDLYVGRLPVGSAAELEGVLAKIEAFETYAGSDGWKKKLVVVSDDEYKFSSTPSDPDCWNGSDTNFMWSSDSVAYIARALAVVPPDTVRYYLARCLEADQPDKRCGEPGCCTVTTTTRNFTRAHCTPELTSLLGQGALVVNYQGHSNRYEFTHETLVQDDASHSDIRSLTNADKPFVFIGLGCWMSDFQLRTEAASFIQDAIGEKFLLNTRGAASASFASACSEYISANASFDIVLARTLFDRLVGVDAHGNPIAARVLLGEALTNALIRYGDSGYASRYLLFGDPAMAIDMGPPSVTAAVDGVPAGDEYVFEGEAFDTLDIAVEIKDEEAIMAVGLAVVEAGETTAVPPGDYVTTPLVDLDLTRSRAYRLTYSHVSHLGEYSLRFSAEDYAGNASAVSLKIRTGSAAFFADDAELGPGGKLVLGQRLRVVLSRPFAFTETAIEARLDGRAASEFDGYSVTRQDEAGKVWEVSLTPILDAGEHTFVVSVSGFETRRDFSFIAARVDILADGRTLYENDFVAADAEVTIEVSLGPGGSGEAIGLDLDGGPHPVTFEPDSSGTRWTASLALGPIGLLPGDHQLAVTVHGFTTARRFRISEGLDLVQVSVFPNPFAGETFFFYTLAGEAGEARLSIYTVSGRRIFEASSYTFPGYNQYRWDGRDDSGDRVANGTYIYKLVVKGSGVTREAVGRVVKLD